MRGVTKRDRERGGSFGPSLAGARRAIRNCAQVALASAVLAGLGVRDLPASQPSGSPSAASQQVVTSGPVIQRWVRVAPRRYVISPASATIAVNQTQHFGVVDADGKPVAVRWNISGLGCYGASCGSMDEQGIYHPPSSLPQPRVVTLEGVVVADPHFSVLTQIRLQEAAAMNASAAVGKSTSQRPQPVSPERSSQAIFNRPDSEPVPGATAAAPGVGSVEVGTVDVARSANVVPLPSAVGAAPTVETQGTTRRTELPPVPSAVAATPGVGRVEVARKSDFVPLPSAVGAAPTVGSQAGIHHAELPPVPTAVAATPKVNAADQTRTLDLVLTPSVVASAPSSGSQKTTRSVDSTSASAAANPVAPNPASGAGSLRAANSKPLASGTVTAPPVAAAATSQTSNSQTATSSALVPKVPISPASTQGHSTQALDQKSQPVLLAKVEPATTSALRPLADAMGAPSAELTSQDGVRVTYKNGQLTIDARNASLADVLTMIAQKTGATIDIPPGSGTERIVEHAGPGSPNDVLTRLLNGSRFNFIIVNSQQHPEALAEVLLSVQSGDAGIPSPVPAPKEITSSALYTPTPNTAAQPMPPRYDSSLTAPTEPLTPEALGELMKEKAKELRERTSQQYPSNPQQ